MSQSVVTEDKTSDAAKSLQSTDELDALINALSRAGKPETVVDFSNLLNLSGVDQGLEQEVEHPNALRQLLQSYCEKLEGQQGTNLPINIQQSEASTAVACTESQLQQVQQLKERLTLASQSFTSTLDSSDSRNEIRRPSTSEAVPFPDPIPFCKAVEHLGRLSAVHKRITTGLERILQAASTIPNLVDHPEVELVDQLSGLTNDMN